MVVALIPARRGSKRVPLKNIRSLRGHPLLAYRIAAARESGIFSEVYVSSECPEILTIGMRYGAKPLKRAERHAVDTAADQLWIRPAMQTLDSAAFAVLRPTSPFLSGETIKHAWETFLDEQPCHSLRAITPATEHPAKMWEVDVYGHMTPAVKGTYGEFPWHSCPTQLLPKFYKQTAGLEIVWTGVLDVTRGFAGDDIIGYEVYGAEALDLNTEADWEHAEALAETTPLPDATRYLAPSLAVVPLGTPTLSASSGGWPVER